MNTLVELHNVSCRYGKKSAVKDVTLTLRGGAVAIVGENGAGKSTLLSVLAGLRRPSNGSYFVGGVSTDTGAGSRAVQRLVGFLPQHASQPAGIHVDEALYYAAWLARVPRGSRASAVDMQIRALGLEEYRSAKVASLSGGLQQRLRIAQAIIGERQVLLLDEPTTAIDPTHRGAVRDELARIAADRLVVFTTHLSEDIEYLAERVLVMSRGQVIGDLSPMELKSLGESSKPLRTSGPFERAVEVLVEQAHA